MSTKIQIDGPGLWRQMHYQTYKGNDVINSVIESLPCERCIDHCKRELPEIRRRYRNDPFSIGVALHNMVNTKLGKPILSNEQAKAALGISNVRACKGCARSRIIQRR